ncbi:MAG: enoyl-[acyl-carrier-protein] reductase FabK [Oscillospiraceae bacterium]|jgi:enoyl-[acyl-carrier protein] reductase II|nr:enoyl-[acyl-carrier-protein] reductase FabK [Oscillospiraceae bacterium]
MKTAITELLKVKYPIIQGAMAWIADANLAAAVSDAGGFGLIAGGSAPVDVVRGKVRKARSLTDKPFGLNIMLMSPNADDLAQLVLDEGIQAVTTGAGSPGVYMERWKAAGVTVIPVVASVALAVRMERLGADAVVCEGCEAGGHIGDLTTMCIVPQVADAVKIPVLAAGGIADGRGVAAAFMLGAAGIQCGTVFLTAEECGIHEQYKQRVIDAKDTSTVATGRSTGHPVRCLKTPFARKLMALEKENTPLEALEEMMSGSLRKAAQDGNLEEGSFMAGQIAGMLNKRGTCREIIENMFIQAEDLLHGR